MSYQSSAEPYSDHGLDANIREFRTKYEASKAKAHSLRAKLYQVQTSQEEVESLVNEMQSEFESSEQENHAKQNILMEAISQKMPQLELLKTKNKELNSQNLNLRTEIKEATKDLTSLNMLLQEHLTNEQHLSEHLRAVELEYEVLSKRSAWIEQLESKLFSFQQMLLQPEKVISENSKAMEELKAQCESIRHTNEDLCQKIQFERESYALMQDHRNVHGKVSGDLRILCGKAETYKGAGMASGEGKSCVNEIGEKETLEVLQKHVQALREGLNDVRIKHDNFHTRFHAKLRELRSLIGDGAIDDEDQMLQSVVDALMSHSPLPDACMASLTGQNRVAIVQRPMNQLLDTALQQEKVLRRVKAALEKSHILIADCRQAHCKPERTKFSRLRLPPKLRGLCFFEN